MTNHFSMPRLLAACAFSILLLAGLAAHAASFEIAATPSRFELDGKSGARIGQSLQIYNVGAAPTELNLRTIDWSYSENGNITYHDDLLPGSCRPWVTLERRSLKIAAGDKANFRFQIDIPADAPRGECRFMLAIEGVEPAQQAVIESNGASLSLPVTGRIAIAVYIAVNGAQPQLEMTQVATREINGKRTPVVTVKNAGDAHGRLDGSLDAVDGKGVAFQLAPETTPILPGQTRTLPLTPKSDADQLPPKVELPFKAKGVIDWDRGGFKVDAQFK